MKAVLILGNCVKEMAKMPENSIDAIVTDPPYGLEFMGKDWDAPWKTDRRQLFDGTLKESKNNPYSRSKVRNGNGHGYGADQNVMQALQDWFYVWAVECLRVLKPGGYLLAFGGSRTYHRLACAVEDAGFEIRDQMQWIFGSGFPKSLDVSKAIDREAGVEREVVGVSSNGAGASPQKLGNHGTGDTGIGILDGSGKTFNITAPSTEMAKIFQGWGTALKPAHEPIVVARKPLIGTVVANVLKYGTGALNINGCRIPTDGSPRSWGGISGVHNGEHILGNGGLKNRVARPDDSLGRWPANVITDGSDEVVSLFPISDSCTSPSKADSEGTIFGGSRTQGNLPMDSGSAARFFYTAKTSVEEREMGCYDITERERGNNHPTVKPVDLMCYLCRLVTPPGGTVLDPFTGSGSTGIAALREGFNFIGIEKELPYVEIAEKRIGAEAPMFNTVEVQRENQ